MFFQTVLQNLLKKKRVKLGVNPAQPTQDLSPMAQNIMQKLAEHDKNKGLSPDAASKSDIPGNK
ncbi:MAG: hypothetical protein K9J35_06270 [Rhodoferax sp.]|uniref:hypothetical protein n=1 Tax=Polynucleobacter sp. MG-Unter2-18 TaxID=2081052 RepID=UPI001BFCF1F1|nr:hypothetical protein [Polynucleobacter sp. MG-Unter2-18]MCF8166259.1 hypothetical protein [Rhodoferax sp.]MCF8190057.1 hypothetical protein [Polynucleobacter sp.]QWD93782.1 hypothetical protein C2759_06105 [Polynucleobacter sp. MG-Unter2-18]